MGLNRQLANLPDAITTDTSNNVGIGGAANASFKLQVTGSGAFNGGATGLILSLDANVSIAKSISFRSNNSPRMSVEVSGSENGSNTGANFQIKRFSDAGSLIDTPFEISRETGNSTFSSNYLFLSKNQNGFTNFYIENTTGGTASGGGYIIRSDFGSDFAQFGKFSTLTTAIGIRSPKDAFMITDNGSIAILTSDATGTIKMAAGNSSTAHLTIASTGAATFSSSVTATQATFTSTANTYAGGALILKQVGGTNPIYLTSVSGNFALSNGGSADHLLIASTGAATFSSNLTVNGVYNVPTLSYFIGNATNGYRFNNAADTLNLLVIKDDGNVGIGTSSPIGKLDVTLVNTRRFIVTYDDSIITIKGASNTGAGENLRIIGDNVIFNSGSSGSGTERMRITSGGDLTLGNLSVVGARKINLQNASNGYGFGINSGCTQFEFINGGPTVIATINGATGVYTSLSDVNKKKDFETSTIGLKEVLELKPTLYRFKDGEDDANKELGFIAQEVKEFIPQAFVESGDDDNKFIGLNYNPIVAALVKAIQEQNQIITSLQEQITELKQIVATK